MKKSKYMMGGIAIAALLFAAYYRLPVIPFQALTHDGTGHHNLLPMRIADSETADAIAATLMRYGEPHFRARDTMVLIPPSLAMDAELRWNYTTKSMGKTEQAVAPYR